MRPRNLTVVVLMVLSSGVAAQQSVTLEVNEEMVAAASALLATVASGPGGAERLLGFDRSASFSLALTDEAHEDWAYWPTERVGVPLDLMTAQQRKLTHALLTSLLSSRGYMKVVNIMQLEQILATLDEGGVPRGVGHYKAVIFGTPSTDAPWAWRFEGHHVSLSVAVAPSGISVTPSFFGANPAEVRSGPLTGFRVLGAQEDLARDLVTSLNDAQRGRAVVSDRAPAEIFSGNNNKEREQWDAWRASLQPEGIPVAELNEVQQHWVRRLLEEVVANYRPELSAAYLKSIDPASLSFAWMGATERGAPHYFRLQGQDFVFEYDNVQNQGNHVHSVWRSKSEDFGMRLLGSHYQSAHR
jgi:Protein of unknown function (DUF3500)